MSEDIPDPATGLTPKEKNVVRDTWAIVKKDIKGAGYELFVRFFTENPSYQSLFPVLKDIPISEIRGNKKILAHATNVLYTLTALVDNLDEPDCLTEMLKKLGGNHAKRGVNLSMFDNLGKTIIGLLKDSLGPEIMNDFAISAWNKTYAVIESVVKVGLDEASKTSA